MSPRVVLDPADHSVGIHVCLEPSPITGLVYVVGDVDLESESVELRWAYSEEREANVLPEMTDDEDRFCRRTLLEEARRWEEAVGGGR